MRPCSALVSQFESSTLSPDFAIKSKSERIATVYSKFGICWIMLGAGPFLRRPSGEPGLDSAINRLISYTPCHRTTPCVQCRYRSMGFWRPEALGMDNKPAGRPTGRLSSLSMCWNSGQGRVSSVSCSCRHWSGRWSKHPDCGCRAFAWS